MTVDVPAAAVFRPDEANGRFRALAILPGTAGVEAHSCRPNTAWIVRSTASRLILADANIRSIRDIYLERTKIVNFVTTSPKAVRQVPKENRSVSSWDAKRGLGALAGRYLQRHRNTKHQNDVHQCNIICDIKPLTRYHARLAGRLIFRKNYPMNPKIPTLPLGQRQTICRAVQSRLSPAPSNSPKYFVQRSPYSCPSRCK
jgi:hypothetical protein